MSAEPVHGFDGDRLSAEETALWRSVVDGGWALNSAVNASMAAHGLSADDLRVFEALSENSPMIISELAGVVHMGVSKVSRQLQRMVDDGFVCREGSNEDGRHRFVRLTDQGYRMLDEHLRVRDQVIRKHIVDALTDDEFATLGKVYTKIADSVLRS